jgi:hypothetical protein
MLATTYPTPNEYWTLPTPPKDKPKSLQLSENWLSVLAAWINPRDETETYWVRGEDTLTYGDQARWLQLKGTLAAANHTVTQEEEGSFDLLSALTQCNNIVRWMSEPTSLVAHTTPMANTSTSAKTALRLGDNAAAVSLLSAWLEDTSGYDEQVWPRVKQSIEQNRLSDRSRFGE